MRCIRFIFIFAIATTHLSAQSLWTEQDYEQKIDFRLFYPISLFKEKNLTRRQLNFAGFDATYYFWFSKHVGWTTTLGSWFIPVRDPSHSAILYSLYLQSGVSTRALPNNYFDPTLSILVGGAVGDAGNITKMRATLPLTTRVGINLYRETEKFQDTSIALCLIGSGTYYLHQLKILKPLYFDFGLTFTGSF